MWQERSPGHENALQPRFQVNFVPRDLSPLSMLPYSQVPRRNLNQEISPQCGTCQGRQLQSAYCQAEWRSPWLRRHNLRIFALSLCSPDLTSSPTGQVFPVKLINIRLVQCLQLKGCFMHIKPTLVVPTITCCSPSAAMAVFATLPSPWSQCRKTEPLTFH